MTAPVTSTTNSLRSSLARARRAASGRNSRVEDDLGDAGAVAQVDEDELAVVAAAVDPALTGARSVRRATRGGFRRGCGRSGHGRDLTDAPGASRRPRPAAALPANASTRSLRTTVPAARSFSPTRTANAAPVLLGDLQARRPGPSRPSRGPRRCPRAAARPRARARRRGRASSRGTSATPRTAASAVAAERLRERRPRAGPRRSRTRCRPSSGRRGRRRAGRTARRRGARSARRGLRQSPRRRCGCSSRGRGRGEDFLR